MTAERTAISTAGSGAQLGAILFLAVVAYPDRSEWGRRNRFVDAFSALLSKAAILRGYPRHKVRADFRRMPNQQISNTISMAERRIWRRLEAADVARSRLLWSIPRAAEMMAAAVIPKPLYPYVTKITRPSSQLMPSIRRTLGQFRVDASDPFPQKDFRKRVWRTTLPVLPLSLALLNVCTDRKEFDLVNLVRRPEWLPGAIDGSKLLDALLASDPEFWSEEFVKLVSADT